MPTDRKRYMVNIPPELEELVILRAKELNRPVANYITWLVSQDLKASQVEEDQAPYGEAPPTPPPAQKFLAKVAGEKLKRGPTEKAIPPTSPAQRK